MSSFFVVSTAVFQGDPLSSTMFELSLQCVANVLKKDKGVVIAQESLKLAMFSSSSNLFISKNTKDTRANYSSKYIVILRTNFGIL